MANVVTSSFLSVNWRDALRGFLIAALTTILATVGQAVEAGSLPTIAQLKVAALAGLTAGISYLIKNFFSSSEITIKKAPTEMIQAVKEGTAEVKVETK